ncbi:MAG: hypothetical protein ACLVJO_04160 [[Clostridium] scindens]
MIVIFACWDLERRCSLRYEYHDGTEAGKRADDDRAGTHAVLIGSGFDMGAGLWCGFTCNLAAGLLIAGAAWRRQSWGSR